MGVLAMLKLVLVVACVAAVSANGMLPSDLTATAPPKFTAEFDTPDGKISMDIFRDWAPIGADRFYNLVQSGFYNNCRIFRNVPNFVAQFGINGDPKVQEHWRDGPANIQDDPVKKSNKRGTIVFATSGPNTRTTQVFINRAHNSFLDSQGFAPIGELTGDSMNMVDKFHASPDGPGAPDQGAIQMRGNKYLQEEFPQLAYFKTAKVTAKDEHYMPAEADKEAPEERFEEDMPEDSYNEVADEDDDHIKMSWEDRR